MAGVKPRPELVRVEAPARLHIGFLDLNGDLGRKFGSIGFAIDRPAVSLRLSRATVPSVSGAEVARAAKYLATAKALYGVSSPYELVVAGTILPHAGFGSGTQLALAIAAAVAALEELPFDAAEVANTFERGARSGIGVAAFAQGGFVVDGGRGKAEHSPPLISRIAIPKDWRVVLVLDDGLDGVSGEAEIQAFRALPPFPVAEAGHLCRLVLMRMLPALAEGDLDTFGSAVTEIQERVGDHFAPAQGGGRFTSPLVAEAIATMKSLGVAGVGQSSWGPTGFGIVGSEAEAERVVAALAMKNRSPERLKFVVARGRNQGARVTVD